MSAKPCLLFFAKAKEKQHNRTSPPFSCFTFAFAPTHPQLRSDSRAKYYAIYLLTYIAIHTFAHCQNKKKMSRKNQNLKRDRFRNVAAKRVQKLLDTADSLSKCANRSNYDYDEEDVDKMMKAIKEKIKLLELAYTTNTRTTKNTFEF